MTMDVLANIAKQYFYSPDGELSPAGVAAVGSVLTAIGGGTVFLTKQLWSFCCGSEKPSSIEVGCQKSA